MAEAVLELVLGNLNSLIQKELRLFWGFDEDLKRLASLFTTIKATLADAEEKQFTDRSIKDWLQKLKDAAYILDDILDECAYEALGLEYQASNKVRCSFLSTSHPKHVVSRYKIAKRMKRISERLEEIADERNKFHLVEMVPERRRGVIKWRETTSFITEPQVYGREEDGDKIVDFLVHDASHAENLSVLPIIGLGGLGKTTLAQLIFHHERIVQHFEPRLWICVSEDFGLKRMTKAIIEAVSGHACEDLDLDLLQRKLKDLLQSKRYLLVLDDVWDDEQENWQRLKSVLACGAMGASILVTTRLSKVAAIMGTMPPHELSKLSDNDCWKLLKHRAFELHEVEQEELVVIGKEIAKKCGGVPLAAKVLGGLLRFKREKSEWLKVKESNMWGLAHNIMPALRLSYLNLTISLRQCFAYCAIFPKDEKIEKKFLVELWMANGFLSCDERLDAEDVGDVVWKELYWRSFFQDIEKDQFGKVTSFKMHDLVHDLAQYVAQEVCCISSDNCVTTLSERIHHLSNFTWYGRSSNETNSIQLHHVKSLRTYILSDLSDHNIIWGEDQLSSHVLKCYSLRVLHFVRRKSLSSSIVHLKHLRYLNLSGGRFETLPVSLCKLWNLQVLKLDKCYYLQKLPNNLIGLKALQQLSLENTDSLSSLPPHIGKLSSLRILGKYIVGKERGFHLAELGSLKLKGGLHIECLGRVKSVSDAKDANMSSKQLNMLWLSWYDKEEGELQENVEEILEVLQPDTQHLEKLVVEGYEGSRFPQWISSPSLKYLTEISLVDCENCLQIPALGKLPSLKKLWMRNMIHVKYIFEESYDGGVVFMALEELTLEKLPNIIRLSREDGENMFPRLSTLLICDCPTKLLNVSASFQFLSHLEDLEVVRCKEVEGLDEALQHMTALKSLLLIDLPSLELRTSLSLLGSLKYLRISGCSPELQKLCEKGNVLHIPSYISDLRRKILCISELIELEN